MSTPPARRGKALFESTEVGCATCHSFPLYTDLKMHDVKTRGPFDRRDRWDTPTLIECWRTGPYLHDGRYLTVEDVLAKGNHGDAADRLSDLQIDDLATFVLSLSEASTGSGPSATTLKASLPSNSADIAVKDQPEPSPVPQDRERKVSIAGHVLGIDGKPAPGGLRVTALPQAWSGQSGRMPSTVTDRQGTFVFRDLPDGPCNVSVTPDPSTHQPSPGIEEVTLKKGKPTYVRLSLQQK